MKLKSLLAITALSISSIVVAAPSAQAASYSFGDTGPAGGRIFLTPSSSGNTTGLYFEVAPLDVSASRYLWCNSSNQTIPGANGTAIGTGKTNTTAMLNHGCTSGAGYQASQYTNGGYSDWFLPSSGEVIEAQKLYGNGIFTGIGLDNDDIHWTSTWVTSSASYIWYPYISGAALSTGYSLTSGGFLVRAVRSFAPTKTQAEIDAENEADRKKRDEERAAAVKAAREKLRIALETNQPFSKSDLSAAELPLTSTNSLSAAYKELLEIKSVLSKPLDDATLATLKANKIMKFAALERITGLSNQPVFAHQLVQYGVIDKAIQMKQLTTVQLMKLPASQRDTLEKINAFYADSSARYLARKDRISVLISKNQFR